jgi:hypothetical protein
MCELIDRSFLGADPNPVGSRGHCRLDPNFRLKNWLISRFFVWVDNKRIIQLRIQRMANCIIHT